MSQESEQHHMGLLPREPRETLSQFSLAVFAPNRTGDKTGLQGFEMSATTAGDAGQQRANRAPSSRSDLHRD